MPDPAIFRIVYCSRNAISYANGGQSSALTHIFETARANNTRRAVTGALLYNMGFFAQVLEGPQPAIEQIFEKIQRDQRHSDVTVLEYSPAEVRDFPDWSMARVLPHSTLQANGASDTLHQAMAHPEATGRDVLELLRSLVVQED